MFHALSLILSNLFDFLFYNLKYFIFNFITFSLLTFLIGSYLSITWFKYPDHLVQMSRLPGSNIPITSFKYPNHLVQISQSPGSNVPHPKTIWAILKVRKKQTQHFYLFTQKNIYFILYCKVAPLSLHSYLVSPYWLENKI